MKKLLYTAIVGFALLSLSSCGDDFVKTDQNDTFSDEKIASLKNFPEQALTFSTNVEAGARQKLNQSGVGNYGGHEDFGLKAVDIMMDCMGQDLVFTSSNWFINTYTYRGTGESQRTAIIYNFFAKLANSCNLTIQSLVGSDPNFKTNPIYGRVLALRAFADFYLLRLYESNGMAISYQTVDLQKNELVNYYNRSSSQEISSMVERDLLDAFTNLQDYQRTQKDYINQEVVAGFLSRYYLYTKDFAQAKKYALIALGGHLDITDFNYLTDGFNSLSNPDFMWGTTISGSNTTYYASFFSHMDSTNDGYGSYSMTPKIIDQRLYASMHKNDNRLQWFYNGVDEIKSPSLGVIIGPDELAKHANLKFIDPTFFTADYEYMRKSEMVLNYIEAAMENGEEVEAISGLNDFMATRQEGYDASNLSGDKLRQEIRTQRRIELWGEGFALLDIKRWEIPMDRTSGDTSHTYPGATIDKEANSNSFIFQFPLTEINSNLQLRPQNPQ